MGYTMVKNSQLISVLDSQKSAKKCKFCDYKNGKLRKFNYHERLITFVCFPCIASFGGMRQTQQILDNISKPKEKFFSKKQEVFG